MNTFPKTTKGIGLLELMLSLAIIALLLVMATKFWGTTSRSQQYNEATQDMAYIMGGLQTWKGSKNDYTNLTLADFAASGGLPDNISSTGTLPSWDGCTGMLTMASTNSEKQAAISFTNISTRICRALAGRFDQKGNSMISATTQSAACGPATTSNTCSATFILTVN